MKSCTTVTVWREVDAVVVGASSGAVAAALELQQHGRRVLVLSDLSYFGEETAGTLNLWPGDLDRTDPLVRAAFADDGRDPVCPLRVKRALERALIDAGVPFLYLVRPVALLRDGNGGIGGVVVAARTALFAVRCRAVVDASRHGTATRLADVALQPRPGLPATLSWTVIAEGRPPEWPGSVEAQALPFRHPVDGRETAFPAFRLRTDRARLGTDPRALEHLLRADLVDPAVRITADLVSMVTPEFAGVSGQSLAESVKSLSDAALSPARGLFLANGLLPVAAGGALALERADDQVALGRRVGRLAAGTAGGSGGCADMPCVAVTGGRTGGDFRFDAAFLRGAAGRLDLTELAFPLLGSADVLVAGGGTGGAPAGIAAARAGVRTLVVEAQRQLGGVTTVGLISGYWYGNRVGFTAELDALNRRSDPEVAGQKEGRVWRPEVRSGLYHRLLRDAGGSAWLGSYAFGVRMEGQRVSGVLVSTPFGCGLVETGCVVDATGDADIAAAAGAPCRVMGADHLAIQGTGVSPRPSPAARGYNSDHTFVDDADPEGVTAALVRSRAKFGAAFDTSPLIDSRERRQIIGEYEVSPLDILARRTFPDTVNTAASNFDTHGFTIHPVFMIAHPSDDHNALWAHVPFRCMLPRGVDDVIVTGLGMSAHRDALPVLRMQADVQNQGFAAGLAAAWSAGARSPVRQVDVRKLQRRLAELGIIAADVTAQKDSFPLPEADIARAARGDLCAPLNGAIVFAHPERSRALLRERLADGADARGREDAALMLGLMGMREAAPCLAEAVGGRAWDAGWNYRGMGQFGPSMSRMDALVLALARTLDPGAGAIVAAKVRELDGTAAFSHCRVVGIAAALLRDGELTAALAGLLSRSGMGGHAWGTWREMLASANPDSNETESRNLSLRELYLARGLYWAGDRDGLGRATLEAYTGDLRGHFARFATAVLLRDTAGDSLLEIA